MIDALGVVVPAHDEQELVGRCLAALRHAARHPALGGRPVHIVTVLDDCSDDTGGVAGASTVEVRHRNVGSARSAGFTEVLRREAGRDPRTVWLATTDADTVVPPDWLVRQLAIADAGWDVVAGTVAVADWSDQPEHVPRAFRACYGPNGAGGHPHVHGANLGLRAAAYLDVGGVPPLALAEDHALVRALGATSARLLSTGAVRVVTSARRESRALGGFSDLLRTL